VIHLLGPDRRFWRSSSHWPALAGMMNLMSDDVAVRRGEGEDEKFAAG